MNSLRIFTSFATGGVVFRRANCWGPCETPSLRCPRQLNLDDWLTLLLRAGELECALCDAGASPQDSEHAARLTDLFAEAALRIDSHAEQSDVHRPITDALLLIDGISYSGAVSVGVQEGFAYYALHPLDYADRIAKLEESWQSACVIGIRSIGTTLSAVAAARLRERGSVADRFTVRPTGHPYDRECVFSESQHARIAAALATGSELLICDEGPGRSGSSLLSVAEALERAGAPRSRILILCSHQPDIHHLCAPDAARRWSRFRSIHTGMTRRLPNDAATYPGIGEWRRKIHSSDTDLPASWPQFERLTYLSDDGQSVQTFEGHGPYGQAVRERNQKLSDAGYGLPYRTDDAGFGRHRVVAGTIARVEDLTPALLTRMAEYCAWRAHQFAVTEVDSSELEIMARVNFEREFGHAPGEIQLPVVRPAICDNRMMPHAWLKAATGDWLKLDAATRGDDHFFPGACDIAWDLCRHFGGVEFIGRRSKLLAGTVPRRQR